MYAVNLCDWHGYRGDWGLAILLQPVVNTDEVIEVERGRFDGMGIALQCDDERADAIVKVIRTKFRRYQLRLYYSKTGKSWKRV